MSNRYIRTVLGISSRRLQELFKMQGIRKCVAVAKPYLNERHMHLRLQWALKYQHWTIEKWKTVIWSDETSICLGKLARRRWVARRPRDKFHHDYLIPAFKEHKKSVMIWGCFFGNTLGPMDYFPRGPINSETFIQLLQKSLMPFIDEIDGLIENLTGSRDYIFQQDNAPIHKSNKKQRFMKSNNLLTMDWPPNSPDLNLIEHIWPRMKRDIFTMWHAKRHRSRAENHTDDLQTFVEDAWNASDAMFLESLLQSMPRRLQGVIEAKGGHTKY